MSSGSSINGCISNCESFCGLTSNLCVAPAATLPAGLCEHSCWQLHQLGKWVSHPTLFSCPPWRGEDLFLMVAVPGFLICFYDLLCSSVIKLWYVLSVSENRIQAEEMSNQWLHLHDFGSPYVVIHGLWGWFLSLASKFSAVAFWWLDLLTSVWNSPMVWTIVMTVSKHCLSVIPQTR